MIKRNPKEDLIPIAKFGKTHGLIGQITIISFCNPPENLLEYKNLFHENGEKICAQLNQKNKKILATLNGLTSIDDVAYLVNKMIYISKNELPTLNDGEFYWEDLIGMNVINHSGTKLGAIEKIENHGATDLIFIKTTKDDLIIPFIKDFIQDVDLEKKQLVLNWFEE